jgi:ABC-type bacteriocin/lantibiotic exporter with double-glycine peptidase domain
MKSINYIKKTFVCRDSHPTVVLCLLSIIQYHKGFIDPAYLLEISKIIEGKTNLSNIAKAAQIVGLKTLGKRSSLEELKKTKNLAILGVTNDMGKNDCIVYYGYKKGCHIVGIPFFGIMQYTDDEMNTVWETKIIMNLELTDSFVQKKDLRREKNKWIIARFKGFIVSFSFYSIVYGLFLILSGCALYLFYSSKITLAMICLFFSVLFSYISYACKQHGLNSFRKCLIEITKDMDTKLIPLNKLNEHVIVIIPFIQIVLLFMVAICVFAVYEGFFFLLIICISVIHVFAGYKFSRNMYKIYDSESQAKGAYSSLLFTEVIEMNYITWVFKTVFFPFVITAYFVSLHQSLHCLILWIILYIFLFRFLLIIPKLRYFVYALQRLYYFSYHSSPNV